MKIHCIIIFILSVVLYSMSVYPGVGGSLDSAEFQISGKVLGISHPTGYPLYHLITHFLSNFPVASLAVRVSMFSSVCTALAALLVMVFVQQNTSSRLFAYAITLLFITNYAVWHNATIAEVYAMQFLIHALCLVLYSQWVQTQKSDMAVWLAFCLGIGMAHHLMTGIFIIGIALSMITFPKKHYLGIAHCYGSIVAFIIPLLTFIYFPIRSALSAHSFDYYTVSTVGEFFHYVLGGNNTNLLRNDPFWLINNSMVEGMKYAFGIVGVFPVLLTVIGFYEWIKTKRVELILFLWLMCVHLILVGIWTEADREAILVPVLLCATVLMAVGAQSVVNALQSWMPKQIPSPVIVVVLLGIVWVLQTYNTYQTISTRNQSFANYQYDEIYHAIPQNAVVLSSYWEETNAYKYLTWSGEYEEKDLKVFRWNDLRSNASVENVINYLRQQSAVGNPALSPKEQRPVVFLQPLDEENQSAFLSLNPIPVSENRFIYQAQLTAELSRDQKGYIPLSQLPWEAIKWNWMEPRQSLTLNGNPLMIADSVYHEGYGIHAGTQIQIPVPSGAKRFSCIIGVSGDLPPDAASTIIAMLSSDHSLLKRSSVLTVKSPKWELDYTLNGETVLLLEIWGTEDGLNADHAVLAKPRFYFETEQQGIAMSGKLTHMELLLSLVYVLIGAVIMLLITTIWQLMPKQDLFISDIEELNVLQFEWKEPQRDVSIDGNSLIIGDQWYPKGIGVHANTDFSVTIPNGFTRFISDVGVDDEVAVDSPASIVFQVIGDGTVLAQSPMLKADMPPFRLDCNIENITQLTLKALNAGDGSNSDHGDWGNARLTK